MKLIISSNLQNTTESTSATTYSKGNRVACYWGSKEGWYLGTVMGVGSKGVRVKYDDGSVDNEPPGRRTVIVQSKKTNKKSLTTEQVHALKGAGDAPAAKAPAKTKAAPAPKRGVKPLGIKLTKGLVKSIMRGQPKPAAPAPAKTKAAPAKTKALEQVLSPATAAKVKILEDKIAEENATSDRLAKMQSQGFGGSGMGAFRVGVRRIAALEARIAKLKEKDALKSTPATKTKAAPAAAPEKSSGKKLTMDDVGAALALSVHNTPTPFKEVSYNTGKMIKKEYGSVPETATVKCSAHKVSLNKVSETVKKMRAMKDWEEVPVKNSSSTSKATNFLFKNGAGQYIKISNQLKQSYRGKNGGNPTVATHGALVFFDKTPPQPYLDSMVVSKDEKDAVEKARSDKRAVRKAGNAEHKERAKNWTKLQDHHLDGVKTKLTDASSADIRSGVFHAITTESHFLFPFNDLLSKNSRGSRFSNAMGAQILTEHGDDAKKNVIEGLEAIAKKMGLTSTTQGNTITLKSSKGESSYTVGAAGFGNRASHGFVRVEPV